MSEDKITKESIDKGIEWLKKDLTKGDVFIFPKTQKDYNRIAKITGYKANYLQDCAEQYVMQIPVDYGDLKEKAELQIKEAYIAGASHAQIAFYFERNNFVPTSEIRALIRDETIVGYEQKWIDKKGNVDWKETTININFIK